MKFNYRTAEAKSQLEFLAGWLALEKEFIPLFRDLRAAGGPKLVDEIYKMVYTGDIAGLNSMMTPAGIAKLKIEGNKATGITAAISSILNIMGQIGDQQIFQQFCGLIKNKDKASIMANLTNSISSDLAAYFSDELVREIQNNPGLLPVLRSGRVGMGAQMGLPQSRMTTDMLNAEMSSAFANEKPFVTNFMNLLGTLLHRSIISRKTLNTLLPDLGGDVGATPQQDFTFFAMCESGADPNSREAQYDVMNWIEATEKIEGSDAIAMEQKLPSEKSLEMIKRTADTIGEEGFAQQGFSYQEFNQLFEVFKISRKPQQSKWNGSELQGNAASAGINPQEIFNQLYKLGLNFEQILLEKIPPIYRSLYLTTRSLSSLSPEEQEAYKRRYPQIEKIADAEETDTDNGRKVRTMQLLMVKNAVTQAWGTHIKRFFEDTAGVFPGMDSDKFVQFMFLDDDREIRKELSYEKSSDLSGILQSENEHEMVAMRDALGLGKNEKSRQLLGSINRLIAVVRSRNDFLSKCGIEDMNAFQEIMSQKTQVLDMIQGKIANNLFGNIPGVAKLWNEPTLLAGREVMDPAFTGGITRSEILKAGGFNPLAANSNFRDAVQKKSSESIDDYKERMAGLLRSLIDHGELYVRDGAGEESPLSLALKSRPGSSNSGIKGINVLVNAIIRAEQNLGIDDFDEMFDPDDIEDASRESIMRMDRKRVLEELFGLENLTPEDVGTLSLNPSNIQNKPDVDSEFAEIGLSTDSDMSAKVLDLFRTYFNLPICSYAIEINSPEECKVNRNGFKMDFSIMADKLITNPDGTLFMEPGIILAGEAFGYKRYTGRPLIVDEHRLPSEPDKRSEQLKRNSRILQNYSSGLNSADGRYKIFLSEDGKQLMSEFPEIDKNGEEQITTAKADRYVEYTIRSSYKEPYETFLGAIIGADMIFIPPFDPKNDNEVSQTINNLTQQLDSLSVIWRSAKGGSKSYEIIKNTPNLDQNIFGKYLAKTASMPYSNAELYSRTLLAHYDLQNIVIPFYLANKESFTLDNMVIYQKRLGELSQQLSESTDFQQRHFLSMQIRDLKKVFQPIIDRYHDFLTNQSGDAYQLQTLDNRVRILNIAHQAGTMRASDVHGAVFGENPLFNKLSVVNNFDYHQFPAAEQQRVASRRWWNMRTRIK